MSKAFTNEETPLEVVVPARAPLPAGVRNYVTARGLELLRTERRALEAERAELEHAPEEARASALAAWAARIGELDQRLASAELVAPSAQGVVRFGSKVTVADAAGDERSFEIVGVDEADPPRGKIAFLSPLAQALLGREPGDTVRLLAPGGRQELEIVALE